MFIVSLRLKFRNFYKSISLINRKMRDKLETKHEKLHILTIHWDRVSLQLQKDMIKNINAEIEQFIKRIYGINKEIRAAMLKEYLLRCDMR